MSLGHGLISLLLQLEALLIGVDLYGGDIVGVLLLYLEHAVGMGTAFLEEIGIVLSLRYLTFSQSPVEDVLLLPVPRLLLLQERIALFLRLTDLELLHRLVGGEHVVDGLPLSLPDALLFFGIGLSRLGGEFLERIVALSGITLGLLEHHHVDFGLCCIVLIAILAYSGKFGLVGLLEEGEAFLSRRLLLSG